MVSVFLVGVQHIRRRWGQYKLDTVYKMNFRVLTMTLKVVLAFSGLYLLSHATPWAAVCQASLFMNSPGKKTGVGCHSLLQGIFPTQGSNPDLLHFRQILYHLSHQGSPFRIRDLIFTLQHSKIKCNIQFSIVHQSCFFLIFGMKLLGIWSFWVLLLGFVK